MKAIQKLHDIGQSPWLDNITREILTSGTLRGYHDDFAVTGLTSNMQDRQTIGLDLPLRTLVWEDEGQRLANLPAGSGSGAAAPYHGTRQVCQGSGRWPRQPS